jgi:hypothetical protein
MMSVHTTANVHVGPLRSGPFPSEHLGTLGQALQLLQHRVRNDSGCNDSFQRLPYRNNFQSFLDNPYIWINYNDTNDGQLCGWTTPSSHPMDIVVTRYALRMGRWLTAATIIHELAHLNGAPGGKLHDAELRVLECKLHSANGPYDPTAEG